MPLYLDRHEMEAVSPEDLAAAHLRDVEVQARYGVRYLSYWFDIERQRAFCLVDAPSEELAHTVHREAHGFVASEIIEVDPETVQSFFGGVKEPKPGQAESAFRTIVFTDLADSTPMTQRLGDAGMLELLRLHDSMVRDTLTEHRGREIKHTGDGFLGCFPSVSPAVEFSIVLQRKFAAYNLEGPTAPMRIRIGMSAGEPVENNDDLFGAAVQLARRICDHSPPERIFVSNVVRELCLGKPFSFSEVGLVPLKGFEEPARVFEVDWNG